MITPETVTIVEQAAAQISAGPIDMAKLLADFGALIVMAAFFIWQSAKQNKKMDEYMNTFMESRGEMLKQYQDLATQTMRRILLETDEKKVVMKKEDETVAHELNVERMSILQNTLRNSNAARVAFISYHNGGHDFIGIPFQRMSSVNEVARQNNAVIQGKYQNMFRTSFYSIYTGLLDKDNLQLTANEALKEEDPALYQACIQDRMLKLYMHTVKNIEGSDIGFVVVIYDTYEVTDDGAALADIAARRIEGVSQAAENKLHYSSKLY